MLRNTSDNRFKCNVHELISLQQWRKLKAHLFLHKRSASENKHTCSDDTRESLTHTALHHACHFHPPLGVIKCLYHADPRAVSQKDCRGNFPLHVACTRGCSPAVIEYLLEKYPQAAMSSDMNSRNPFLLACKSYLWNHKYSQQKWKLANQELLDVLQLLNVAAPKSFTSEDCDGMAPIDYIIDTKATQIVNKYVVQLMSMRREKLIPTMKDETIMNELEGNVNQRKSVLKSILRSNTKYSQIQPVR